MIDILKKIVSRLEQFHTQNEMEIIMKAFDNERHTSLRINTIKSTKEEIESELNKKMISFDRTSFSDITYIIDKDDEYELKWSRIFYDWKIYVQWISSMIPAIVLNPSRWDIILDMTAAPWSKTTQIAAMIWNEWKIIACEQNQIRFDKLKYNINLQWANCVETIKIDSLKLINKFKRWYFDKIILDAPCSAEWRINMNNEKTFWFWTEENILKKQKLQIELLKTAIILLKTWWELIYSTCTMTPEENEEVINQILIEHPNIKISDIEIPGLKEVKNWITAFKWNEYDSALSKTKRILPTEITEGFYIAKLTKS